MSEAIIIGAAGLAGSGKDEFADMLVSQFGFRKYSFAKPIKDAVKVIFDWTDDHVYGHLKEVVDPVYGVSPREAMQKLGTEWRDMINRDLWIIRAKEEIAKGGLIIIPDVRFDHEAQFLKELGAKIVLIDRPDVSKVRQHSSEAGLDKNFIDIYLKNSSTLDQFRIDCVEVGKVVLDGSK